MGTKPLACTEDHSTERVVSFQVNCPSPENVAWQLLRDWVIQTVHDYRSRRYIGCAPKGHHSKGEGHHPNEEVGSHEYTAQMFLLGDEGTHDTFMGADVRDAPKGLWLVGDVVMNEFQSDGTIDIGSSVQKAYSVMSECLHEMGGYEFELKERPYYEEHIFTPAWFTGKGELAGFKLWLPISQVTAPHASPLLDDDNC